MLKVKSAVLITLVYHRCRKEIRSMGQDLPLHKGLLATLPGSLISFEAFVTKASWNRGQHMLWLIVTVVSRSLHHPVSICHELP